MGIGSKQMSGYAMGYKSLIFTKLVPDNNLDVAI